MATHHHEKQRQKKGFVNFYKFSKRNSNTPKSDPHPVVLTNYRAAPVASPLSKQSRDFQKNCILSSGRRSIDHEGGGGARKSVSHVETNVSSVAAFLQVKVLVTDMPGFMQVHAFRCARRTFDALDKFSSKHMAYNIKKTAIGSGGMNWIKDPTSHVCNGRLAVLACLCMITRCQASQSSTN